MSITLDLFAEQERPPLEMRGVATQARRDPQMMTPQSGAKYTLTPAARNSAKAAAVALYVHDILKLTHVQAMFDVHPEWKSA